MAKLGLLFIAVFCAVQVSTITGAWLLLSSEFIFHVFACVLDLFSFQFDVVDHGGSRCP